MRYLKIRLGNFTLTFVQYWEFLASNQTNTAVQNIYKLNEPLLDGVPKSRFFLVDPSDPSNQSKWRYNPRNTYNSSTTTGTITHLMQDANTLGAEINIAAQATVLRKSRGTSQPVTASDELIRCSQYGDPDRNSDPRVRIYETAREMLFITNQMILDRVFNQSACASWQLSLHQRSRCIIHDQV